MSKVGASKFEATWAIRVWPSPSRWSSAQSTPASTSSRTTGSLPGRISIWIACSVAPGGSSASNSSSPSAGPASSACRLAASQARSLPMSTSTTVYPALCAALWAPLSTRPKNGLVMSGTTSATLRATPVRSARAATFGR